jgi:glycosyltransferase involved in cell wall biosynthesis/O-antigen/teichoic acid export membrane protein
VAHWTPARVKPRDREFTGAFVYAAGLGATAFLGYAFNAAMGRRLSSDDFGTFAALLAGLLALSGPTTALFGGAAMSAARSGRISLPLWRLWIFLAGIAAGVLGLFPLPEVLRSAMWFGCGAAMWMLLSWNRGLLIGVGRLGVVGATSAFEGIARLSLALVLVARGWRVAGASAGLALGIGAAFLLTQVLLPRDRIRESRPLTPEVWAAVVGLFFLSMAQFPDVVAVRLANGHAAGSYAAASSIARIALYAQAAAAAYALRRAAVVGARGALPRALLLSMVPAGIAVVGLEVFPGRLLSLTYGGRYLEAAGLVRILAPALAMGGLALVLVTLMMGAGRSGWAWLTALVSALGTTAVFTLGSAPHSAALAMLTLQAALLVVAVLHAHRLFQAETQRGGEVLVLNWRDTRHPQGGGSEVYVEQIAQRLAERGRRVTIFCAEHENAPREEIRDGVRFIRRGSWRTVYLWAAVYHLLGRFGPHEVVVDVQNAIPFFSPLWCGRRVVALVHHVHQEQWEMLFGPRVARAGWWVESRLAPKVYGRTRYVAVSQATRADLVRLGVDPGRISVVQNGSDTMESFAPKATRPTLVYLGRLVPHKRIELLLDAAAALRSSYPELEVRIVGHGPWDRRLRDHARTAGVDDLVVFEGFVDDDNKRDVLARAWVLIQPSVKEGWGLSVVEAAAAGTPAVAFRVGGLTESIMEGRTGSLADDFEGFVLAIRELLDSPDLRQKMGTAARARAAEFSWDATASAMAMALDAPRDEVREIPNAERPPARSVTAPPVEAL